MLFGCSAKPLMPQTLECPKIDLTKLERPLPHAAMGDSPIFPSVPGDMAALAPEQQAAVLVQTMNKAAESYSTCELNRHTLVEWILNKPVPDNQ